MDDVLPFLHFFWPGSAPLGYHIEPNKRTERIVDQYSIVDDDLGAHVDISLLVPLPKTDPNVLRVYQHVLDGGFGGRLMIRLREENGWVYDVHTKMHYGADLKLEISTQCNIEDVLVVRDELYSVLSSMGQIQPEELERYRWSQIKERREKVLLGMPYLVSSFHNREDDVPPKDLVEEWAKKIGPKDVLWILRGREYLIRQAWPADWNRVSFED